MNPTPSPHKTPRPRPAAAGFTLVELMVGLTLSTERVTELLLSLPSALVLPAESENFELATEMTPSVVLSAVGVNVAE